MPPSVDTLGPEPSLESVDQWMQSWGRLDRRVVGKSYQGRDLVLYELSLFFSEDEEKNEEEHDIPSVLFLSLVHGNEPMGLLSLLWTVQEILSWTGDNKVRTRKAPLDFEQLKVRILFFPIVNVDAYTANLKVGQGCRRKNLHDNMGCAAAGVSTEVPSCSKTAAKGTGVDLNRNFPSDWDSDQSAKCTPNYGGEHPFSEPETRAIRSVVGRYNNKNNSLVAAMSFHSRASGDRPALLIHPYASRRPFRDLPADRAQRYREWGSALNADHTYERVGTALETIEYWAGGTTMDWLETAHNCTTFVVEVRPPCSQRWCSMVSDKDVMRVRGHAKTSRRLLELVVSGSSSSTTTTTTSIRSSIRHGIPLLFFALVLAVLFSRKRSCFRWLTASFVRRIQGKDKKDVAAMTNNEIVPLADPDARQSSSTTTKRKVEVSAV